ncbi:hypothetical protein Y695_01741 [Hydrogenophaga sp. T4]|nr:hypothetical protein Y695_01741 [Hydrogenophaga sp. T4]
MRQVVESREAKKRLGFEPVPAKGAELQKVRTQPARLGQRGQHQGVDPEAETQQQTGQGATACAAFPVQAAQHGGGELRHRGETDEADADQRVGLARQVEIQVAQQQDAQDGQAPDAQQQAGEVTAGARTEAPHAQQEGHDQVVADHSGNRDRFDDHHAGRGGEPADEGRQRQRPMALRQGQRKDEGFRIHAPRAKVQQATDGNGQHKQVDQQQVERKHPDRAAQVLLVDVSTTITWNCRGRKITDSMASRVRPNHCGYAKGWFWPNCNKRRSSATA